MHERHAPYAAILFLLASCDIKFFCRVRSGVVRTIDYFPFCVYRLICTVCNGVVATINYFGACTSGMHPTRRLYPYLPLVTSSFFVGCVPGLYAPSNIFHFVCTGLYGV